MTDTTAPAASRLTITDDFDFKSLAGLSLLNALLFIVTLGVYGPWAITKVLRKLAASIRVNGEPLVYTGRGLELFLGWLIFFAIAYGPMIVFAALAPAVGETTQTRWGLVGFLFAVWMVVIFYLAGAGYFILLRYLATRTQWRGARFNLVGSPWDFALRFLGYLLLTVLTIGWFAPAAGRRLSAYVLARLRLGQEPFKFDLDVARLEKIYPMFAVAWVASIALMFLEGAIRQGQPGMGLGASLLLALVFAAASTAAVQPYYAALWRSVISGLGFQGAAFKLDVRVWPMVGMAMICFAILVLSLGILFPLAMAVGLRFFIERLGAAGELDLEAAAAASPAPAKPPGLGELVKAS